MRRALPVVLLAIAAGIGAIAWFVLRGEPALDGRRMGTEGAARASGPLADPAIADGAAGADRDGAAPPIASPEPTDAPEDRSTDPQRIVEAAPRVDVHGWVTATGMFASDATRDHGHVVLRSVATSRSRVDVKAAIDHGTFDLRLPGDAVVKVTELVLDGEPLTTEAQLFDLAQSTWLEVRATRLAPTTLQVIDAASGLELGELRIADEQGTPLPESRILAAGRGKRVAGAGLASPVTLAPTFPSDAAPARSAGRERLRVGAPGHATLAVDVDHGAVAPTVVALPLAARLIVEVAPWPDESAIGVVLLRLAEDDEATALPYGRPRPDAPEARSRVLPPDGVLDYDDLAPGNWRVVAEGFNDDVAGVPLRDQATVDVRPGDATHVQLDVTRSWREQATLRILAHDASNGAPIAISAEQVQVRSTDSEWPVRGPKSRRLDSSLPPEAIAAEELLFRTIAGPVEVDVAVVGERLWRPTTTKLLLARGDNVLDVPLVATAALRLMTIHHRDRDGDGIVETLQERLFDVSDLRLRDARGTLIEQPEMRLFGLMGQLWYVEPGRYDVVFMVSKDDVRVLQSIELEAHRTDTVKLDGDELARLAGRARK